MSAVHYRLKRCCIATMPDGTVVSRNTHRTYTHAIARFQGGKWFAPSFAGSLALAEREMSAQQKKYTNVSEWRIVPVIVEGDADETP